MPRAGLGPDAVVAAAAELADAQAAERVVGVVVAVLRGYGLAGDEAIHGTRIVRAALHGFAALEAGEGFGIDLSPDETFARLVTVLDRGLAAGHAGELGAPGEARPAPRA